MGRYPIETSYWKNCNPCILRIRDNWFGQVIQWIKEPKFIWNPEYFTSKRFRKNYKQSSWIYYGIKFKRTKALNFHKPWCYLWINQLQRDSRSIWSKPNYCNLYILWCIGNQSRAFLFSRVKWEFSYCGPLSQ